VTRCVWSGMRESYAFSRRVPVAGSVSRLSAGEGNAMGRTIPAVAAVAGLLSARGNAQIAAVPDPDVELVLELTNDAQVPSDLIGRAKQDVAAAYRAAGVRVVWTDDAAPAAAADNAFRVEVRVIAKDLAYRGGESEGLIGEIFGIAWRSIRRTYIFYDPLYEHARRTDSNVARLLAAVMAHEVGHVLLPPFSHSRSGIMRAAMDGRIVRVPGFTPEQADTIRKRLAREAAEAQPRQEWTIGL
jgi:hypothetical protein